jgi:hypothetical protein
MYAWALLAVALSAQLAGAQVPQADARPARPFCSIPPALPPALDGHGAITVVRATFAITMTNSGQPCGRQHSFAPQSRLELVRQPTHGTVALTGLDFAYTPSPGYLGPDSFVIRINSNASVISESTFNVSVVTADQAH